MAYSFAVGCLSITCIYILYTVLQFPGHPVFSLYIGPQNSQSDNGTNVIVTLNINAYNQF